jgi:hypothetical protein
MKFHSTTTLLLLFLTGLLQACTSSETRPLTIHERREALVNQYCSSCHLPVGPELLDQETWKNRVLPAMGKLFGLQVWNGNHYYQDDKSAISFSDWSEILAYYDSLAPVEIKSESPVLKNDQEWNIFSILKPKENPHFVATSTLVAIDSIHQQIYTSSSEVEVLTTWDQNLIQKDLLRLPAPAVHVQFTKENQKILTTIGEMKAVDTPKGQVHILNQAQQLPPPIADQLVRPIHTQSADLNRDGLMDYVVCSFGHHTGGLYWLKQKNDNSFEKIPIREIAGATQTVIGDFDEDGWPDIMALFAHGNEGIWLFSNNQNGGFIEKNILQFPPVYGSSSFQLTDINRDGWLDIIYTAGDNSDYSRILKPYHGLYIFLHVEGKEMKASHFEQSFFYPINGSTKAMVADFDLDGQSDIAVISFFADLKNNPSETFMLFKQHKSHGTEKIAFTPHYLPIQQHGRWICMDVQDLDQDGDPDIILGNYAKGFMNEDGLVPNWNKYLPFIVLKNNTR